jgi:uncharacterized coiled-coil protein SlyX
MSEITVYDIERECGLEQQIRSQASVAFTSPIVTLDNKSNDSLKLITASADLVDLVKAGLDDPDLYHVFSILVSTVWNRNDDIFNKDEVWAARHTPRFKPTNLEHDEKQMVGGIVNSWPVDTDFKLISDDTQASDLPDEYHLLVASVIYRQWQDPELKARAEQLISEIDNGSKFVSMECLFRGFDYGIVAPDGNNHVVARNESTAFLSQHLRSYGGTGSYQDHKVGRVLRNITFSGKGFVDRPANPDSIIFDKDHIFSFANVKDGKSLFLNPNGVTNTEKQLSSNEDISIKENRMSNELLSDQIKELKEALASVKSENKELTTKLSEANVSTYEGKIKELESTIAEFETNISDLESKLSEATTKAESLESDLAAASEELKASKDNFKKMEDEKKKKDRKDKMSDAGLSKEEVEAKYEAFADLSDNQFDVFIETIKAMKPAESSQASDSTDSTESSDDDSTDDEDDSTEASDLVDGETEDGGHAVSGENSDDDLSTARAGLSKWVEECIMNNTSESK